MTEEQTKVAEEKAPTKEEIVQFLKDQIEIKALQAELQDLAARISISRFEEQKHLIMYAQMMNPQSNGGEYEGGTIHKITKEDMEKNPELKEQGLKEGDEVILENEKPKNRNLKKV